MKITKSYQIRFFYWCNLTSEIYFFFKGTLTKEIIKRWKAFYNPAMSKLRTNLCVVVDKWFLEWIVLNKSTTVNKHVLCGRKNIGTSCRRLPFNFVLFIVYLCFLFFRSLYKISIVRRKGLRTPRVIETLFVWKSSYKTRIKRGNWMLHIFFGIYTGQRKIWL